MIAGKTSLSLAVALCGAVWIFAIAPGMRPSSGWIAAAEAQGLGEQKVSEQSGSEANFPKKAEKTSEEIMQARYPQPVKVGHLLGLPVLDFDDSTIGYVQRVIRSPDGKVKLILPYGKRFGWVRDWWPFKLGRRPVAVPIEVVAILALQINALEMARADFDKAPTWVVGPDQTLEGNETIKIALGRR